MFLRVASNQSSIPEKPGHSLVSQHRLFLKNRNTFPSWYCSLRKAWLVFSHAHRLFKLKSHTPFLALEIYIKVLFSPQFDEINKESLKLASLVLAMKYEEIYPPSLKTTSKEIGIKVQKKEYIKLQAKIVLFLDGNLNLPLLSRQLEEQIQNEGKFSESVGLYLLQISILNPSIYLQFKRDEIINAICLLMKGLSLSDLEQKIIPVAQLILKAGRQADLKFPSLFRKYSESISSFLCKSEQVT